MTLMLRPAVLFAFALATGCANVERTITVTSEPSGALVRLNGREIGRTPVETEFLYYGVYDVELERDGCEPLVTTGEAKAPWWDTMPLDLAAELTPGTKRARVAWHFELPPVQNDRVTLINRAQQLRHSLPQTPNAAATQADGDKPAAPESQTAPEP